MRVKLVNIEKHENSAWHIANLIQVFVRYKYTGEGYKWAGGRKGVQIEKMRRAKARTRESLRDAPGTENR